MPRKKNFASLFPILIILLAFNSFSDIATDIIQNRFTIDSLTFDTDSNLVNVYWSIDTTLTGDSISFSGALNYSYNPALISGSANTPDDSSFKSVVGQLKNPTKIDLGHDLLFENTLHVGLWMKAKSPTDSVKKTSDINPGTNYKTILIPEFSWQKVNITDTTTNVAYPIANGAILFRKSTDAPLSIDRVELSGITIDSNFIEVGSPVVRFRYSSLVPFDIGFRINKDSLDAKGLLVEQTGLYRIQNDKYEFFHNCEKNDSIIWHSFSLDSIVEQFPQDSLVSITVLSDTISPVIDTTISPLALFDTATSILTFLKATDNISNSKWKLLFARGDLDFSYTDSGYCDSTEDTLSNTRTDNLSSLLTAQTGTRIMLELSDGINRVTKNLSLSVTGSISQSLKFNAGMWMPFYSKVTLAEDSIYNIFNGDSAKNAFPDGWSYDKTEQRIFRYTNVSATDTSGWVEYSDTTAGLFNLVPGRVVWAKSRENIPGIKYGVGTSSSLRDNFELSIDTNSFTDFTLPFYFNVSLSDLIEANDTSLTNHIDIYQWVEGQETDKISAIPVYLKDSTTLDSVLSSSSNAINSSYTIFNHSNLTALKIPPISEEISNTLKSKSEPLVQKRIVRKSRVSESSESRQLSFINWRSEAGEWGKLLIATGSQVSKNEYSPAPAGFSSVSLFITDDKKEKRSGYLSSKMNKDGLAVFKLIAQNRSDLKQRITLSTSNINNKIANYAIYYIKNDKLYDAEKTELSLSPNSSEVITVVAGTRSALNSNQIVVSKYKFALLNNFPNPFNSVINLKYRLPQGVKEVKFSLFNSLGQKVYSYTKSDVNSAGDYTHNINTNNSSRSVSSGAYFTRITAIKKDGSVLNLDKKVICIK